MWYVLRGKLHACLIPVCTFHSCVRSGGLRAQGGPQRAHARAAAAGVIHANRASQRCGVLLRTALLHGLRFRREQQLDGQAVAVAHLCKAVFKCGHRLKMAGKRGVVVCVLVSVSADIVYNKKVHLEL